MITDHEILNKDELHASEAEAEKTPFFLRHAPL